MEPVQLKIRALSWSENGSAGLEAGPCLSELLVKTLAKGHCPPVALAIRGDRAELIGLADLQKAQLKVPHFLASLSRSRTSDGVADAVGLMGVFRSSSLGEHGAQPPVALVFLEWGDCSWWYWRALVSADGTLMPDTVTVSSAAQGDPMPGKIGRWWSFGRRANIQVGLRRADDTKTPSIH